MNMKIMSYVLAGAVVFALLWWLTVPEIALTLFGMPLVAVALGALYEGMLPKDSPVRRVERRRAAPDAPSPFRRRVSDFGALAAG